MGRSASTHVAPRAWAFVVGAAVLLGAFLSGVDGPLLVVGLAVGALLVAYFVVGCALDRARGRHSDTDDGPSSDWSTTGPSI